MCRPQPGQVDYAALDVTTSLLRKTKIREGNPLHHQHLLLTKLTPPRGGRWHLPRPHLTEILQLGMERRLTALIASAGHGKTSTLAHFLHSSGTPYMWLQLDPGDQDLVTFTRYLSHGIQRYLHGGSSAAALAELGSASLSPAQLLPLLVEDLMSAPTAAVVLDDMHLVAANAPVVQLLADLVTYGPEQVHFYICSRTPLPFSTARLKVSQDAGEIDQEDLRFTPPEIGAFFREMADITLDPDTLEHISHLTEGWSAALVLLASALKRRGSVEAVVRGVLPADLFTYLADEVLKDLPAEDRTFLEESAILDTCSPELCDALLDRRDSAARLSRLTSHNMLITPLGGGTFRYHHLFQRFLQERLKLRDHGAVWADLHRRAGGWFVAQQLHEEAVRYYLRGGSLEEAARLVESLAPVWARSHRIERLHTLLALLPAETRQRYPWISLCEAWWNHFRGNSETALGLGRQALRIFAEGQEHRGLAQAHVLQADVHVLRHQFSEARQHFETAAGHLQPGMGWEEALFLERRSALTYWTVGPTAHVERDLRRAIALYIEQEDAMGEAKASDLLAAVRCRLGDYATAVRYLERSVAILKAQGEPAYEVGVDLGWVYMLMGQFTAAAAIYEPMLASSTRKIRRAFAARSLLALYTSVGQHQQALNAAQTAHSLMEDLGQPTLKADLACELSRFYRLTGQGDAGVPYAREALELTKTNDFKLAHVQAALQAVLFHLFHTGNAMAARRMANKALARIQPGWDRWQWTLLTFCEAIAAFRLARTESRPEPVRLLQEGLTECARRGYQTFALHEWPLALSTAIYGLAYGVQSQVALELIQVLVERLPNAARATGIPLPEPEARLVPAAWQALPDDTARQGFSSLLTTADRRRVLSLAVGPSPLRIQCLGPLTVAVNGDAVDRKSLKRRKAGQLLALLLASDGPVPRDRLLDSLWPDLDPAAADTSLRVALHHLRRLLEPHLAGRGKSRYIQSEGGLVWFSREPEVQIDLDRFRHHLKAAESAVAEGETARAVEHYEALTTLYRGDVAADEPYAASLDAIREELQQGYADALAWLGEYFWQELQEPARSMIYYRQRLTLDEAHEPSHQALIRIYLEMGQVAEARQQYLACRDALRQHLGVEPSRATESLHQVAISLEHDGGFAPAEMAPPRRWVQRRGGE